MHWAAKLRDELRAVLTFTMDRISIASFVCVFFLAVTTAGPRCIGIRLPTANSTNSTIPEDRLQNKTWELVSSGEELTRYRNQTGYLAIHAIVYLLSGLIVAGATVLSERLFGRPGKSWWNLLMNAFQLPIAICTQGSEFVLLGLGLASRKLYPAYGWCQVRMRSSDSVETIKASCVMFNNDMIRLAIVELWFIIMVGLLLRIIRILIGKRDKNNGDPKANQKFKNPIVASKADSKV